MSACLWVSPMDCPMKYSPSEPYCSSVRFLHSSCFAWSFSQVSLPSSSSRAVWSSEVIDDGEPVQLSIIPCAKDVDGVSNKVNKIVAVRNNFFILLFTIINNTSDNF